jgi:folate-binding protein YgfZ
MRPKRRQRRGAGPRRRKAAAALQAWFDVLPAAPYAKIDHALGTLIRVADAFGAPRYQWLMSAETAETVLPALEGKLLAGAGEAGNWRNPRRRAADRKATQEQFVPQMVNFELLGGVNFKKGCYPGQEIVARSQYLGKLKRRTTLVSIPDASAAAGMEVFATADPEQPCGMIVNAAPNGNGGIDALVEMKLAAIEAGSVRLGSAEGTALTFLDMPYVLEPLDLCMDLYIYYKVKDADAASLQAAVIAMQARLAQRHGVAGELKRRPGTRDGVQTWMEVYPATPAGCRHAGQRRA